MEDQRHFKDESVILESQLEKSHLELLLSKFKEISLRFSSNGQAASIGDKNPMVVSELDEDTFCSIIVDMFSPLNRSSLKRDTLLSSSKLLFEKIDWKGKKMISWDDVCSYLVLKLRSYDSLDKAFVNKPRITKLSVLKDSIAKVIADFPPTRLILVTKEGQINVISSDFTIQKTYQTENSSEISEISKKQRRKPWVTDFLCISEINKLVIATANRDIQFYDQASPNWAQQFHLCGLPNTILCLHYHYIKSVPYDRLLLFIGTDSGSVNLLFFHMANKSLFDTPFKKSDSCWKILFNDLSQQTKYVSHIQFTHTHSDWVKRILYEPIGELLFSCSNCPRDSLVYRSINEKKRKVYVFRVTKGIQCFDYSKSLGLLATGGVDHILRLWDPYVTSKPMAILKMHQTSIIDIVIYEPLHQVFSYSKDGVLYAWDVKDHSLLQSIHIKFPLHGVVFEHSHFPLCLINQSNHSNPHNNNGTSPNSSILVIAEDCIAELKLLSCDRNTKDVSHKAPVVSILYSPIKNQVISASENGEIVTWNLLNGKKLNSMQDNKSDELSAFAIDKFAEYAVTGYRDGSGTLWNLKTGSHEKSLVPYSEDEITNAVILPGAMSIFLLGWSKKILAYKNSNKFTKLKVDPAWLSVEAHKDDIISAVYWKPHFLATGTFDGDVFIWNLEHKRLWKKIQIGKSSNTFISKLVTHGLLRSSRSAKSSKRKMTEDRPIITTSSSKPCYPPVEFLLYLHHKNQESQAPLIAVEGNTIKCWSTTAIGNPVPSFSISDNQDDVITAITSDVSNDYLIAADNQGFVYIYDMKEYGYFREFSRVVSTINSKQNIPLISTNIKLPVLLHKWKLNGEELITTLSCCSNNDNDVYLNVGTNGGCVSVFTLTGSCVGLFHQNSHWILDQKENGRKDKLMDPEMVKEKGKSEGDDLNQKDGGNEQGQSLDEESRKSTDDTKLTSLPVIVSEPSNGVDTSISKLTQDIERIKCTEMYKMRQLINEELKEQKESLSHLGESFNKKFKKRMEERRTRRLNSSEINKNNLNESGGLSNLCSPFKTLVTKDCQDFILPEGLPITPKMVSHSVNPYNAESLDKIHLVN